MSIADNIPCEKVDSLEEMTLSLSQFANRAAAEGVGFHEFERELLDRLLAVGHSVTSLFISQQGDGDLGETVVTSDEAVAYRSEGCNRTSALNLGSLRGLGDPILVRRH